MKIEIENQIIEKIWRDLRNQRPKNDDELWQYIKTYFDFEIPNKAVCENHCSPFQFVADVFFERETNILGFASRASGKTRNISILHMLNSFFKEGCDTCTIGAIELQAQKCYQYLLEYQTRGSFSDFVESSRMGDTRYKNGSRIEVLPATLRSINSPHPQKAFLDEVELVEWDIFQEFLNMSHSNGNIKAQNILISTRKWLYGTMQRILDEKLFKVYLYCIFEVTKRCNRDCEDCKKIVKGQWKDGTSRNFFDVCKGRMKKSNGFVNWEDVINRFQILDRATWESQQECLIPDIEGLIHSWFEKTEHIEIRKYHPIYRCIDWGGTDPFVCLWFQKIGDDYLFFDEVYQGNIAVSDFLERIQAKEKALKITEIKDTFVDPEGKDCRNEFEKRGIKTTISSEGIEYGLQIVKSLGEKGHIKISNKCANLTQELREYSIDKPSSGRISYRGKHHACDAMRYGIIGMINYYDSEPLVHIF